MTTGTTEPTGLNDRERRLLGAARDLAGVRRIPELVQRLRPALPFLPEHIAAGLSIHDEERGFLVYHALDPLREEVEVVEVRAGDGERTRFDPGQRNGVALPISNETASKTSPGTNAGPRSSTGGSEMANAFLRAQASRGARYLALAPLFFGERLLGTVFVARRTAPPQEQLSYLDDLAKVVEPHVWCCLTEERFSRGDRRRDALRELSRVINTSLDPRVVLHLARSAIGSIEGHRTSWIGLLDAGGATWRRYDRPAEYLADELEPGGRPVEGTVLAQLISTRRTYESDDLARQTAFRDDRELLEQGVRRYAAAPLCAGGKLLGAFLFGTDDPHPILRIDVWLMENIAVQIALAIDNALHYEEIQRLSARREQQNAYLREEIKSEHESQGMIGSSRAMRRVQDRIARVAGTESTVLITGPTGVGKELVARAIHEASRRKDQPLVKLNCAAIPEGMVESELFGHERGAFTSAVDRRIGRFELGHNGTLFLDEIGELSLPVQAKLLRVLQSGEFERVGGSRTLTSNARIIASTNRDLSKAMEHGSFRSDLFYRLNVFPIEVPPLDERREDIPLLAQAFVDQFARRMGKRFTSIAPETLDRLCARCWPGNVRELKHVIERAVILCDLPELSIDEEPAPARQRSEVEKAKPSTGLATLDEVEEAAIRSALLRTGGVVEGPNGAAALLGLKGSTLRFRMKRKGIRRPDPS
jgi:formate hydrogenlyase transcriptional activator